MSEMAISPRPLLLPGNNQSGQFGSDASPTSDNVLPLQPSSKRVAFFRTHSRRPGAWHRKARKHLFHSSLWNHGRIEMTEQQRRQIESEIFHLSKIQMVVTEEATFLGWSEKANADHRERELRVALLYSALKKSA